jgi:leader peptidase (prepilin peptidase)/N-methyltransferase
MDVVTLLVLFVFGIAIGSFVNVLALRYGGDHFIFNPKVIGGRSHCPHCKHTLRWFELIPVLSFLIQGARCRNCKARIGFQYPLVELLSGLIFVFVPIHLRTVYGPSEGFLLLTVMWVIAFELLLLLAYIDIRLQIVPDEINLILGVLAIFIGIFAVGYYGSANQSFFGFYAGLFGWQNNFWISHLAGALIGAGFFWLLVWITPRIFGKEGMGMGDVKLALPLGFLFGWPDILLIYITAFIVGAVVGIIFVMQKKKTLKGAVPFVPFLTLGAAVVFFFGLPLVSWYFRIMGL